MNNLLLFFKTKGISSIAAVTGATALLGTGGAYAADTVAKSSMIGEGAAYQFALLDAGVDENEVTYSEIELEREGFGYVYDVEFVTEEAKYSYEIDVNDGSILEAENTFTDYTANTSKPDGNAGSNENQTGVDKEDPENSTESGDDFEAEALGIQSDRKYISLEEARSIALSHACIDASKAIFYKAQLEKDEDIVVYDIEFSTDFSDYDYEIDAYSGVVVESSVEAAENDHHDQNTQSAPINQTTQDASDNGNSQGGNSQVNKQNDHDEEYDHDENHDHDDEDDHDEDDHDDEDDDD